MTSLLKYTEYFSKLNTAKKFGLPAPHKAILILSIIELIEEGSITNNRITLTQELEQKFLEVWGKHVGESMFFQPKIATPFWHLQNEPFWSLHLKNGKSLSTVTSPYSVSRLRENTFAVLDPELCDLILDTESREILKTILIKRYITDSHIDINTILPMLTIIGTMFSLAS